MVLGAPAPLGVTAGGGASWEGWSISCGCGLLGGVGLGKDALPPAPPLGQGPIAELAGGVKPSIGGRDGWTDGRTDGWMDGWMDGWTDGLTGR